MSPQRWAYLVNSTPKYYGLLPLHFTLLQRYAPHLGADLFLATEVPTDPRVLALVRDFGIQLLPLKDTEAGHLDSRRAALEQLQARGYKEVMPIQEDFLLEARPMEAELETALALLRQRPEIASVRLMPSPGPAAAARAAGEVWAELSQEKDTYGFTFQATMWRLDACLSWYTQLCDKLEREWPWATTEASRRIDVEVRANFAENADGQRFFWEWTAARRFVHLAWRRAGTWSNAVYLCPWPYRPTAIVRGRLETWAGELAQREGVRVVF